MSRRSPELDRAEGARTKTAILAIGLVAGGTLGALFVGCDAGGGAGGTATSEATGPAAGSGGGDGEGGAADGSGGATATTGAAVTIAVASSSAASTGSGQNPCGTACGPIELCDGVHQGLDDDCDGTVDEDCPCSPGQASDCFKGDPSYIDAPGCFPGSMRCSEFGEWGTCDGGAHPVGENPCQEGSLEGCHPITAVPFQVVNLKDGTGVFSDDADAGSESWTVECPEGIDPCPAVGGADPADDFQPLQSGEYTVTYRKEVDGEQMECTYPLNVGARGLRVELTWNFGSTDYDLHMMQPGINAAMDDGGSGVDCAWDNCQIGDYANGSGPEWFPQPPQPEGDPVAWYLDPVDQLNTCYYSPRGQGDEWREYGRGCHNPRLDLDNVSCTTTETDVNSFSFCAPENVNIDFPPNDQWIRVGVVDYDSSSNQPTMKIFCDGALKAVLGPEGYNAPLTLSGDNVWYAADIAFVEDECSAECVVQPLYLDPAAKTPYVTATGTPGPAFAPLPEAGSDE